MWYGVMWHGVIWRGVVWYGVVWCHVIQYGLVNQQIYPYGIFSTLPVILCRNLSVAAVSLLIAASTLLRTSGCSKACSGSTSYGSFLKNTQNICGKIGSEIRILWLTQITNVAWPVSDSCWLIQFL